MNARKHYDNHLADFYSWMLGDFEQHRAYFQHFLENHKIYPQNTKIAIDLGAGHGIQSVALANLGFEVNAIDFSTKLLGELELNAGRKPIRIFEDDIRNIHEYKDLNPELIVCCGDTLPHLNSKKEVEKLINDSRSILSEKGKLILSFREYSTELKGNDRFIPVKSDHDRILTCILDYQTETLNVTDLLYEKTTTGWKQKISSYNKVRITTAEIVRFIENSGMKITFNETINRMQTIIAEV